MRSQQQDGAPPGGERRGNHGAPASDEHLDTRQRPKTKRSDWGLTWNVGLETGGWLVSDESAIELEVAADEVAAVPAVELAAAGIN